MNQIRIILAFISLFSCQVTFAQRITRQYNNVSFSAALKDLNARQDKYSINFVYDELEDFKVTKSIRNQSVPDAILQLIGFYPIKMKVIDHVILVECMQKAASKMIGRIVDDHHHPILFANVSLLNTNDSTFITGGVTNENGQFVIPCEAKRAIVKVSCVGYQTVRHTYETGKIGNITLREVTMNMQKAVVVVGEMINQDASKETVFITDSLRQGSANAIQMLGKIKGITTDWGTDEINIGKDKNVPIIVNGKEVKKEYAISLNPQRIKRIEIMHYPAGKYSAYPVVLNLVLTNDYVGWDVGASNRDAYFFKTNSDREMVGANFNYTLPKLNIYGNFDFTHRQWNDVSSYTYSDGKTNIKTDDMDMAHPNLHTRTNLGSFSLGLDYKFAQHQTLSLQTWMDKKGVKENDKFQVWKEDEPNNQFTSDDFKTGDYVVGMYYAGSFGKKLNLSSELIYNRYNIHEDRLFSDTEGQSINPYKGNKDYWRYNLSVNYSMTDKWSLMADYTMTRKEYCDRNRQTDGLLYQSSESRNKVMGAVSYQPNQNLDVLLGTHVLQVKNEDKLKQLSDSHTSWMPLLKGYWRPMRWMRITGLYFCDVEYPNLDQLSSVEWQENDVLWHRGNANLNARIMHYSQIEINFVNTLKLTYMHKQTKDEMIDFYLQEDGKTYQTLANCNFRHNYVGAEGDCELTKSLRLSFVANYQWYHRYIQEDDKHFGRTWYLDTEMQWKVPKTELNLKASYFLRHDKYPLIQGKQYNQEEDLFLGASYSFFGGKMPVSLSVKVPTALISKRTYTKIDLPSFTYHAFGDDRVYSFALFLNAKYHIGKGKTSKMSNGKNVDAEK